MRVKRKKKSCHRHHPQPPETGKRDSTKLWRSSHARQAQATRLSMWRSRSWSAQARARTVMEVPIADLLPTPSRLSLSNPAIGPALQAGKSDLRRESINFWKKIKGGSRLAKKCISRSIH